MTAYPQARQVLDAMPAPHRHAFTTAIRLNDTRLAQKLWTHACQDWQTKQSQPQTLPVTARLTPTRGSKA